MKKVTGTRPSTPSTIGGAAAGASTGVAGSILLIQMLFITPMNDRLDAMSEELERIDEAAEFDYNRTNSKFDALREVIRNQSDSIVEVRSILRHKFDVDTRYGSTTSPSNRLSDMVPSFGTTEDSNDSDR